MISKAQVKHIRSLDDKKKRYECKQFIVEGDKMVRELLQSGLEIVEIFALKTWIMKNDLSGITGEYALTEITDIELARISSLKTPNEVLAIVLMPDNSKIPPLSKAIALDNIQDPGNLGSIIRIADWYGMEHIICNIHTVDVYNSKVLQATMGSIFRVKCFYTDLETFLLQNEKLDKYACVLDGQNVNECDKVKEGIIIIGNESKGIDERLVTLCNHKVTIPKKGMAESLNAAVATGIICNALL